LLYGISRYSLYMETIYFVHRKNGFVEESKNSARYRSEKQFCGPSK